MKKVKVTKCMKEALALPEDTTHLLSSELPWNGILVRDWKGPTVFREFRAGLYLQALQHLAECWKCRLETGISSAQVSTELQRVLKELKEYL
ncbi:MAG: hypothetical protein QW808_04065 [Desulfurococcaceae archaeon]